MGPFQPGEDRLFPAQHGHIPFPSLGTATSEGRMLWDGREGSSERFCLRKRRSPCFASPPAALGKDTAFSCWRLNQYLLWDLPSSCTCMAGDGGPGDPDSTGARSPTEQGGCEAPKALKIPAVPRITPHSWGDTATTKIWPSEETQHCSRGKRSRADPKCSDLGGRAD